ncbi:hypothetical protein PG5_09280 [Pseudomonas sp. G5(2012)]|nr:hypothetical protein PG5_09280 [Pseudomonas sp. G5(2012)]
MAQGPPSGFWHDSSKKQAVDRGSIMKKSDVNRQNAFS